MTVRLHLRNGDSIDFTADSDETLRLVERWHTNPSGGATINADNGTIDVDYADVTAITITR